MRAVSHLIIGDEMEPNQNNLIPTYSIVILSFICLSSFSGCAHIDNVGSAIFIPPAASAPENTVETHAQTTTQPITTAEPTVSQYLTITSKAAAGSGTSAPPSNISHSDSAVAHLNSKSTEATTTTHDPAYVIDGLCTPLEQNGAPQSLTLAVSLSMAADQIWEYVKTIETACKTDKSKTNKRIVTTGFLTAYDPQFVQLKAEIDCGDPAVLKCTLQNGRSEIVDVTLNPKVPMLWRWNVQALSADPLGESRILRVAVSGARNDGKFTPITAIPDIRIPIQIAGFVDIVKYITNLFVDLKEMLIAIAAVITLIAGWIKYVRPQSSTKLK